MASHRKAWLDWERGLAVLFMVEVHTLDAWLSPGEAHGGLWATLLMIGGFAAPSFLFMAGLSQSLADRALEGKGRSAMDRATRAISRALWLFGVAYAFRLGEYLVGGAWRTPGGWQDILRVDILNVIALSLMASAALAVAAPPRLRPWLMGIVAMAVALLTPVVAGWQHPPSRILDYLYAVWPRANFSLFPWAGFLLAGSAMGRMVGEEGRPWSFLALGVALFLAGLLADRMPAVYALQDFWHTSPAWFLMRLGGVVALTGALQLLPQPGDRVLGWLRPLGRHSLLGYVASVELTYGAASRALHQSLSMSGTIAGILAMVALVWAMSRMADSWALPGQRRSGARSSVAGTGR
jgi:uncharacterized membrane protein